MTVDGRRGVPFPPLNLRIDQQQHYQDLTFQLLDRTLRSYDDQNDNKDPNTGSSRHHSILYSSRWKQLRTQWNASFYVERTQHDLNLTGVKWDNPCTLLAVGIIDNRLDEIMFGIETPDFLAMQIRSETLGNRPIDGALLTQLAGPTESDPFRYINIFWMVGEQSWPLNLVVRPRDFVFVSATGVVTRANGERIGYEVVQSIDLFFTSMPSTPQPDGARETHMYVETHGRILDKLVVAAMWESTMGFWNAPRLSESKKLQWCIDNKSLKRQEEASALAHSDRSIEPRHCEKCLGKRSQRLRRNTNNYNTCAMCATPLCTSCSVKRTLKFPGGHSSKLRDFHVAICRTCMQFSQQQCPGAIAMDNAKQQQDADEREKNASRRLTLESVWDQPKFSPLGSARQYPSISVSDLVSLIYRFGDSDVVDTEGVVRRKTDPLH